ncbi:MAG: hypothetical protein GC186_12250 [Rhodobacteraceae bacterium]|nr:hypothetical protein [Paracoccaceae bacterium]
MVGNILLSAILEFFRKPTPVAWFRMMIYLTCFLYLIFPILLLVVGDGSSYVLFPGIDLNVPFVDREVGWVAKLCSQCNARPAISLLFIEIIVFSVMLLLCCLPLLIFPALRRSSAKSAAAQAKGYGGPLKQRPALLNIVTAGICYLLIRLELGGWGDIFAIGAKSVTNNVSFLIVIQGFFLFSLLFAFFFSISVAIALLVAPNKVSAPNGADGNSH